MAKCTVLIQNWTIISQDPRGDATGKYVCFHTLGDGIPLGRGCPGDGPGFRICVQRNRLGRNKRLRTRLFAWWYFTIAAGFILLAINRWMLGERTWLIVVRFMIAAGFLMLGARTWRSRG